VVQQGEMLTWLGRPEEGIEWIRKAMQLNPYHPQRFWSHLGRAYFVAHRYRDAIEAFKHLGMPDQFAHAFMAVCCAELRETAAAAEPAREVLRLAPDSRIAPYLPTLRYKQESDRAHHRAALEKAGLPA